MGFGQDGWMIRSHNNESSSSNSNSDEDNDDDDDCVKPNHGKRRPRRVEQLQRLSHCLCASHVQALGRVGRGVRRFIFIENGVD